MTSAVTHTWRADPELVRKVIWSARYYPDDDLEYQIEAIEHVFWMARDAGVEHDTDYLTLLASEQAAFRQVLNERASNDYQYQRPRGGYERAYLDELKRNVPLLGLIEGGLTLRRQGKNYVALCPFHRERTPSFTVFPTTNSYYCFGCGQYGDAITWLRNIAGMDFRGAVRALEVLAGVGHREAVGGKRPSEGGWASPDKRSPLTEKRAPIPEFVYHSGEVR